MQSEAKSETISKQLVKVVTNMVGLASAALWPERLPLGWIVVGPWFLVAPAAGTAGLGRCVPVL